VNAFRVRFTFSGGCLTTDQAETRVRADSIVLHSAFHPMFVSHKTLSHIRPGIILVIADEQLAYCTTS